MNGCGDNSKKRTNGGADAEAVSCGAGSDGDPAADSEGSPPPPPPKEQATRAGAKSAAIGSKIHHFEHAEREKVDREEKELKKALFARKLSKFSPPPAPTSAAPGSGTGRRPSDVKLLAEKFQNMPDPETERELRKRKEEFERKRSGFLGQGSGGGDCAAPEDRCDGGGTGRLQQVKLLFEDRNAALALEEEAAERKRKEEEELLRRKRDFDAKSSMFRSMSNCH